MAERSWIGNWTVGMLCGASTIVCGSLAILSSIFSSSGVLPHKFARFWSKTILFFSSAKVEVIGKQNIPRKGAYIFIANHQSLLDIPIFFSSIPLEFRVLAKKKLFSIPFMGWTMSRAGYIPVDKFDSKKLRHTLERAKKVLDAGTSLLIFAEGGRSPDGKIGRFKSGAFYLALRTGAPIIPVAICGSRNVLPKGAVKLNQGHISIHVGEPVETRERSPRERDLLREEIEQSIKKAFSKFSNTTAS